MTSLSAYYENKLSTDNKNEPQFIASWVGFLFTSTYFKRKINRSFFISAEKMSFIACRSIFAESFSLKKQRPLANFLIPFNLQANGIHHKLLGMEKYLENGYEPEKLTGRIKFAVKKSV